MTQPSQREISKLTAALVVATGRPIGESTVRRAYALDRAVAVRYRRVIDSAAERIGAPRLDPTYLHGDGP